MEAVTRTLAARVRERLAAGGIDAARDPRAVRDLIDRVIDAHAPDMLPTQREQVESDLMDDICGLGPLQALMDDPDVEEIWINSASRVFVARSGVSPRKSAQCSVKSFVIMGAKVGIERRTSRCSCRFGEVGSRWRSHLGLVWVVGSAASSEKCLVWGPSPHAAPSKRRSSYSPDKMESNKQRRRKPHDSPSLN